MRNKKIEAILVAWWNLDRGDRRQESLESLHRLLDDARQGTQFSREQLLDHLWGNYKEFKRTHTANEKLESRSE